MVDDGGAVNAGLATNILTAATFESEPREALARRLDQRGTSA
jgi:hypothetical protein